MDINNAFLHGFLDEEVYIMPPEGYSKAASKVCKLKRSLYGLKEASRQWNKKLTKFLIKQGFQQSKRNYSLFTRGKDSSFIVLLVYVDDVIITSNDTQGIVKLKQDIDKAFTIKYLEELRYFLGVEVSRSSTGAILQQRKYAVDILMDMGLTACKLAPFSIPTNLKLSTD